MVSDFWKEDDFIQDEVTIPDWTAEGRFILKHSAILHGLIAKQFAGLIFLNGSPTQSICRIQASMALSSCEAGFDGAESFLVSLVQVSCWR